MKKLILLSTVMLSAAAFGAVPGNFTNPATKLNLTVRNDLRNAESLLMPLKEYSADCNLTAATDQILTTVPEGTLMQEVVWSSKACFPMNNKVEWTEITGFVPSIVTSGNKMYIYSPLTQLSELASAWIVGNISADGKSVVFPTPQAYMINEATPGVPTMLYATRVSATTGKPEGDTNLVFSIGEDGGLVQTDGGLLALTDINGGFYGYGDMDIKVTKITDEYTTLPEGAEPETFILNYRVGQDRMDQSAMIARVGNDVYFSDLLAIEGVWFKGTLEDNKVIVKTPQYMSAKSGYPLYLVVAEEFVRTETDPLGQQYQVTDYNVFPGEDIVFDYYPATGTYSTNQVLLMSSDKDKRGIASAAAKSPLYTPWTPEACDPSIPIVNYYIDLTEYEAFGLRGCMLSYDVPNIGTEGEFIPQENLYYTLYFDDEPVEMLGETKIPYYGQFQDAATQTSLSLSGKTHQLQIGIKPKSSLGLQSYYYFNGELLASEMATYAIINGELVDVAVESVAEEAQIVNSEYFDLTGRCADLNATGIVIRRDTMSDGTVRSVKTFNRK